MPIRRAASQRGRWLLVQIQLAQLGHDVAEILFEVAQSGRAGRAAVSLVRIQPSTLTFYNVKLCPYSVMNSTRVF